MKSTRNLESLAEWRRAYLRNERLLSDTIVAFPAKVNSYDAALREVEIESVIVHEYDGFGGRKTDKPTPIPNVRVLFPGGSGGSITWTLNPGDFVLGIACDQYLGRFLAGAMGVTPGIDFKHSYATCVCLPVNFAPTPGDGSGPVLINGGAEFLARADRVDADIAAIKDWLVAHTHAGFGQASALPNPLPPITTGSASDTVKGA